MRARIIKTISAVKKFLRIDAEGREDETMKNVLLLEQYGIQSRPPVDSQCVVINDGGINYALNADSSDKKKSLAEKETVLYSGDNAEIYLKPNGTIEVKGTQITVKCTTMTVDATTKIILNSLMTEAGQLLIKALINETVIPLLDGHSHYGIGIAPGLTYNTGSMDGTVPPDNSDPATSYVAAPRPTILSAIPTIKTSQFKAG